MPFFPVLLVVVVAVGLGGYAPWSELALELGAAGLFFGLTWHILWRTSRDERARHLDEQRALKSYPFFFKRPGLGALLRLVTFGTFPRGRSEAAVEIVAPGEKGARSVATLDPIFRPYLFSGYALPRSGLELPVLLLTLWIGVSLLPMPAPWLGWLSPRAETLQAEGQSLIHASASQPVAGPTSLTPFLTVQSLWVWLALLAVFYFTVHAAGRPRGVERLSALLFWTGIGFGAWGVAQWLFGLQDLVRTRSLAAALRATGPFGNRNHYAAFMEMTLLVSLGWLGYQWARARGGARRGPIAGQETSARLALFGLGIVIMALGLIFSLSRSGISFALVGCASFALLSATEARGLEARPRSRTSARRLAWGLALAVAAAAVWIGISPVLERFELIPQEWEQEKGRWSVWVDSSKAVGDFFWSGSGLGSFGHLFPHYRTFGGNLIYLWAHNDYLQALIELGAPGMLLLVSLIGATAWRAAKVRQALASSRPLFYLDAGYCSAAIAIAFHSFTDFGLHLPANAALFAVVLAAVVGMRCRE
jgi:O-antigen ligase